MTAVPVSSSTAKMEEESVRYRMAWVRGKKAEGVKTRKIVFQGERIGFLLLMALQVVGLFPLKVSLAPNWTGIKGSCWPLLLTEERTTRRLGSLRWVYTAFTTSLMITSLISQATSVGKIISENFRMDDGHQDDLLALINDDLNNIIYFNIVLLNAIALGLVALVKDAEVFRCASDLCENWSRRIDIVETDSVDVPDLRHASKYYKDGVSVITSEDNRNYDHQMKSTSRVLRNFKSGVIFALELLLIFGTPLLLQWSLLYNANVDPTAELVTHKSALIELHGFAYGFSEKQKYGFGMKAYLSYLIVLSHLGFVGRLTGFIASCLIVNKWLASWKVHLFLALGRKENEPTFLQLRRYKRTDAHVKPKSLEELCWEMQEMSSAIHNIQEIYAPILLLYIGTQVMGFSFGMYSLIRKLIEMSSSSDSSTHMLPQVAVMFVELTHNWSLFLCVTLIAARIPSQITEAADLMRGGEIGSEREDEISLDAVNIISNSLGSDLALSARHFVSFHKSVVIQVIGGVVTYFVILLQFQPAAA
ncbi:unnamed protein product [Notodromas monacha]|uniref:Gustatory receptor n=1 Tax=Notodromas monacha TaxID=399045 RepID=A0A7R9GFD7_9CRUS|nr:unnamed protein product [Notodromas monacha]CAG0920593.1 unnamed protein product [Notodromas monacha]